MLRLRVFSNVLCDRRLHLRNILQHLCSQLCLYRNIDSCRDNGRPRRAQHDVRGLRIKPEIEFAPRIVHDLRIFALRIQAPAHEHQSIAQLRKMWIETERERQVCHWAALVDGHFVRMFMNHPHKEMRSVFTRWLLLGFSLSQWRNFALCVTSRSWSPCALVNDSSI